MSGVIQQKARLGQGKGPDVELIVTGTQLYATYETSEGFPAIYDKGLELFCYAVVDGGAFRSTGVPVTSPPPSGVVPHAAESDDVRADKIATRQSEFDRRAQINQEGEES